MKGLLVSFFVLLASNVFAFDSLSGWWYSPAHNGYGFSIEIQGSHIFLARYAYYKNGDPGWISCDGVIKESNGIQTADLNGKLWSGWSLGSDYYPPKVDQTFRGRIVFNSENSASIELRDPDTDEVYLSQTLKKFMPVVSPGALDPRDINGWWYDPSYTGMGFFLEARGGDLFLAWYFYGQDHHPFWLICAQDFPAGSTVFEGSLKKVTHLDGGDFNYEAVGEISIYFLGNGKAAVDWPGGTLNLERFRF